MTTEQLKFIGDSLRAQPATWQELPAEVRAAMTEFFRPLPFPDDSREWLSRWVLGPVSDADKVGIETLYGDIKPLTDWSGRLDADGWRYYGADLLTDALDGRCLSMILPVLQGLTLRDATSIQWSTADLNDF